MRKYLLFAAVAVFCLCSISFYAQKQIDTGHPIDGSSTVITSDNALASASSCKSSASLPTGAQGRDKTEGSQWKASFNDVTGFIENKGQFDERDKATTSPILYAMDNNPTLVFFTKDSWCFRFDRKIKNPNREKGDPTKPKKLVESDYVRARWVGANPNVTVVAEGLLDGTYTYAVLKPDRSGEIELAGLKSYQKLIYKNLYPGIDVEYTIHPEGGIKYNVVVHPGADLGLVKLQYTDGFVPRLDGNGQLVTTTSFGDIVEHMPVTFYEHNKQMFIPSKYKLEGNIVSFELGAYDSKQTVVIDPWIQSPTLGNAHCLWECDKDAAGNAYVIGGDSPMKLQKYNTAGVLQWTYVTPWDTANYWLGTLATDFTGNSYITSGAVAGMRKVSTAGTTTWIWTAPIFSSDEYWTIVFNCDQSKLIVGGTTTAGIGLAGCIFDINPSNGNVLAKQTVGVNGSALQIDECRSLTSSKNAKYYYLTLNKIGAISQDLTVCNSDFIFQEDNGYSFSYKSEFYRPDNGNGGISAIRANDKFVYTHNGATIHRRSLVDGSINATAAIPGGINTVTFGQSQPGNSGLDIDACGNVYVGSATGVVKYDENLNLLSTYPTSYRVFDVSVSIGGEIIASGGTGTPSSATRAGFVEAINMNACVPFTLVCCNATICPAGPFCTTDPPVTLQSVQSGGVWSGPGITNSATGAFSPAAAGSGSHTIIYTMPCGSDTIYIDVTICASLEVCIETNGNYTATGGTAPYTWERGTPGVDCSGCPLGICLPVICPGVPDTTWTTFSTNATATPPGTFPVRVTDSQGNVLTLFSSSGILPCTTCPNYTTTVTSQTNIDCVNPTGSATVSSTGGTAPYTYNWNPGNLSGATQSGLAAGTYTVIATDASSCLDTVTLTITSSGTPPSVTATATPTTCGLNNGTATATGTGVPPITYQWLPIGTIAQTITNLAPGDYVVIITDGSGCSAAGGDTVTVAASSGFTTTVTTTDATCTASDGTATATNTGGTGPFVYSWSPSGGSSATASNLAPGVYTVQVTDASGCTATASDTVGQSSGTLALSLTNPIDPTCAGNDGSITVGLSGGTAPYTVTIDTGGTPIVVNIPFAISQTVNNLPDGTVNVTVVDAQGCQVNNSATLSAPNCCTFSISAALTQPTCGQSNGDITLSTSNGSGNYSYTWANGAGTGNTATNLAAGTYNVTITDNAFTNCFIDTSFVLNSNSTLALNLSNPINPTCAGNDGSITVDLSGGSAPYTVTIDTGGTPIVVNIPFAISQTVSNLPAGTVNVTVVDAQGCQVNNSATLTAPANCCTFTVSAAITQPTCSLSNGQIVLSTSNGSGNYTYVWANGAGTGTTASNLAAGTYDVTITDNAYTNCFIDTSFTLVSNNTLTIMLSNQTNPTCANNNGSFTLGINGGTAPYVVTIDTGGTSPVILNIPTAGSQIVGNLPAGNVSIVGTDAQGCEAVAALTLFPPANCCTFTVSAAITQPTCGQPDGNIVITTANGSGNHTYSWANGAGTGNTASNLLAGSYDVTITDDAYPNCFIDTTFSLVNPNAPTIALQNQTNVACAGDSSGTITITVSGGTPQNTIVWSTGDTTLAVANLTTGTYTVTVTDANNCAANASYTITGASAVLLQMAATPIDCNDPNSGTASVNVSGGTGPFRITWSNGANLASPFGLSIGWYTVTVTDANGCIGIDSVEVTGDNVSAFNLGPDLNICLGDSVILGTGLAGTIWSTGDTSDYLVVTNGGTYYGTITSGTCSNSDTVTIYMEQEPNVPQLNVNDTIVCDSESLILRVDDEGYLYVWSTGDTSDQILVDTPGIYIVTAINNCGEISAEAFVSDSNCACRLYLPNAFSPNGDGANDVLKVYTQCTEIEEFSFSIFDRWGGLVYRSHDFQEVWNGMSKGKNCIPGVYVYSISYLSRENGVRQIQRMKGSVTLIR